jgi:hypothetical protein
MDAARRNDEAVERLLFRTNFHAIVMVVAGQRDLRMRSRERDRRVVVVRPQDVRRVRRAPSERGDSSRKSDATSIDDGQRLAQLLDLVHVVAREEDRDAALREVAHARAHVARGLRIERARGLVEKQEAGLAQERGGQRQPLSHPGGVAAHARVSVALETHPRDCGVDAIALEPLRAQRRAVESCEDSQILAPREVRMKTRRIHEARDCIVRRVAVEERDRACVLRHESEHHPHQRRLAGAIRSEQPVNLSASHGQIDRVHHATRVVALCEPARREGGRICHRCSDDTMCATYATTNVAQSYSAP